MRKNDRLVVGLILGLFIFVALFALFLGLATNSAHAQVQGVPCGQNFVVNAQGAGTVKVVADPSGNARAFICGYVLNAGAAASAFQFISGTGGACAGGQANLSGSIALGINGVAADSSPVARGMVTPPGVGACIIITGTGPLNGNIYYTQQ